jgi:hypothetical protein
MKNYDNLINRLNESFEPLRQVQRQFVEINERVSKPLKPMLELIKNIQKNNTKGKKIRGEVITAVIDLENILDEIIMEKYIKSDLMGDFENFALSDESFSIFLKFKIVARTIPLDKKMKNNIQTLIETRNILAHSKYVPTIDTVKIFHKNGVKDISSLKTEFDKIFFEVKKTLQEISNNLEEK